ncbi:unnamed protein product [Timema podura]|uniref:Uncharacterized protein n=1 Tax=Timema podura TaxID=61482 RepID=A0ABN7PA88_TIMPD|nr:unnamed protein product [Timema podura]
MSKYSRKTIWNIRVKRLQEKVLIHWPSFTIWNAGKQGRHFYKSLGPLFQEKVAAFCDVDVKKVGKYYAPYEKGAKNYPKIPIIHFKDSTPPMIICVKLDLTGGSFEENIASLNLIEGTDYYFV